MSKVVNLAGEPTGFERNEALVSYLEEILEKAQSGEVVGMVGVNCIGNGTSEYFIAGRVGGFGPVGALQYVCRILTDGVYE